MRTNRTPFFGMPEDAALIGSMGDGSEDESEPVTVDDGFAMPGGTDWKPDVHPDAVEKGIGLPLGFMPHRGENRRTRRAAVANWQPPKEKTLVVSPETAAAFPVGSVMPNQAMPTRRELWLQRQKHRRGKLDPELRRLQRKALKKHGT